VRWTSERKDAVRRMWVQGSTSGQIADMLGDVSRNAVMGMVDRLGLMGNRKAAGSGKAAGPSKPSLRTAPPSAPTSNAKTQPATARVAVQPRTSRPALHPAATRRPVDHGTIDESARHAADWRTVVEMVEEIMKEDYDPARPGHRSSLIAIASIVGGGDARSALPEGFPESAITKVLDAMAEGGLMTDGTTPTRWLDATTGDLSFLIDMLVLDGVIERPPADRPRPNE